MYRLDIYRLYYKYCLFSIKVNSSLFNSNIKIYNFCISVVLISLCFSIYNNIILTRNLGNACIPSNSLGSVIITCKTIALAAIIK